MPSTLNSTTSFPIHLDLLRHLVDAAALADRRTALTLAVLSKMTQTWVEPIIYTEVYLRHESSGRAFLKTMRTSKTKPPPFFARHVKSLVISSDVEAQLVVEILAVCRGLLNFSYWATPNLSVQRPSRGGPSNEVAPQRMSVFLHQHHIHPLKPHFNLVFFSSVTHLSILNSWEDWTTWNYICSDALPALTHIKFDLNVQGSRPCNIGVPNFQNSESESRKNLGWNEESTTPEYFLWPDIKLSRVANTLTEVLNHNRTLRVCILLLRFDTDPTYTAKVIARLASQKLFRGRTPPKTDHDTCAPHWFDPRLVFAHEREPFRYSHAHSKHEMMLWKSAETIVNSQQHVTRYTLLDCGGTTAPLT